MSDTSAETYDFLAPRRRAREASDVERSSPIVFLGGIAWLAIVLSGLLQFFALNGVNVYYQFVGLFVPFFAVFCLRQVVRLAENPIFWMWILTIVMPAVLYVMGQTAGAYSLQTLKQRIIFFSLVAGSAVILGAPDARRMLRVASLIVLAWAIPICFLELIAGQIFSTAEGRSAGLYGNPNAASMAILICVIGAVDLMRQTTRSLLIVSLGTAAVFTTFSRGGMLFAAALWAFHAFFPNRGQGGLRGPQRLILVAFLVLVAGIATVQIAQRVSLSDEAAMRLHSILTGDISDASSAVRASLVEDALDLIEQRPWGQGLGFVEGRERLPHNTYLYIALDYGLPGALFYVALLLAGLFRSVAAGWQRGATAIVLSLLLMYASLFTHYVMATTFYSVAFAALLTGALIAPPATNRTAPPRASTVFAPSWER